VTSATDIERARRRRVFWGAVDKLRASYRRAVAQRDATVAVGEMLRTELPAQLVPPDFAAWAARVSELELEVKRLAQVLDWLDELERADDAGAVEWRLSESNPGDLDIGIDPDVLPSPPGLQLEQLEGLGLAWVYWVLAGIAGILTTQRGCDYLEQSEETARAEMDREVTVRALDALEAGNLTAEDREILAGIVREWRRQNDRAAAASETTLDKVARVAGYGAASAAVLAAAWVGVTWLRAR